MAIPGCPRPHVRDKPGALIEPWIAATLACNIASSPHTGPHALASLRARRLQGLVRSAARDSPLYRRLLGATPEAFTLDRLPVVHKADLMRDFDDWVTEPDIRLRDLRVFLADEARIAEPYLGRFTVWQSSGSTGEPAVFVEDPFAMGVYDAVEALRRPATLKRLIDPWFSTECIVFVGATNGHFASIVSTRRARRMNPALHFALHELSFLQPVGDLVEQLSALAPTILCTYPSLAVLLAGECRAGRLRIALKELWTGGETLTASVRAYVERSFACHVWNSYGTSEMLPLAAECAHGRLHLNADWAILEPVDEHCRALPDDVMSASCLLTNLANRTQPIIRYDLGDSIMRLSRRCSCGSCLPVIDVRGRQDDILWLDDGEGRAGVSPLAACGVLEDEAGLFDFQLAQRGPASLCLSTSGEGDVVRAAIERARASLGDFLARQGVAHVRITTRLATPAKRGASGKARRVIAARRGGLDHTTMP